MDDYTLLKKLYKHLNIEELMESEPELSRQDIDTFFQKIRDALGIMPAGKRFKVKALMLYTDGASRGNPGPAAVGCVLKDNKGNTLLEKGRKIGKATSNVAEYQALLHGLDLAAQFAPESLIIYSDSELLVKQMTGVYKTKNWKLVALKGKAVTKLKQFKKYSFVSIPREKNETADALANEALDEKNIINHRDRKT